MSSFLVFEINIDNVFCKKVWMFVHMLHIMLLLHLYPTPDVAASLVSGGEIAAAAAATGEGNSEKESTKSNKDKAKDGKNDNDDNDDDDGDDGDELLDLFTLSKSKPVPRIMESMVFTIGDNDEVKVEVDGIDDNVEDNEDDDDDDNVDMEDNDDNSIEGDDGNDDNDFVIADDKKEIVAVTTAKSKS